MISESDLPFFLGKTKRLFTGDTLANWMEGPRNKLKEFDSYEIASESSDVDPEVPQIDCCVCPGPGTVVILPGRIALWVHISCSWFLPKVDKLIIPRTNSVPVCTLCGKEDFRCTQCCNCSVVYHAKCAVAAGYLVEFYLVEINEKHIIKMISYCAYHRPPHGHYVNSDGDVAACCWIYSSQVQSYTMWETARIFHTPHCKQKAKLCWLYTLCEIVEGVYRVCYPDRSPIRISKQYILDYVDTDDLDDRKKVFGLSLWSAFNWALKTFLVLEDDYYPFSGVREKRTKTLTRVIRIGKLVRLEGNEQEKIDVALSRQPVGASIRVTRGDRDLLKLNPMLPYYLSTDENVQPNHALTLSGQVSYVNSPERECYIAKDPECSGREGRFLIKKLCALVDGELNPIRYVAYPSIVWLSLQDLEIKEELG